MNRSISGELILFSKIFLAMFVFIIGSERSVLWVFLAYLQPLLTRLRGLAQPAQEYLTNPPWAFNLFCRRHQARGRHCESFALLRINSAMQSQRQRWFFCLLRKRLPRPPAFLRKQDGGLAMTFCKSFLKSIFILKRLRGHFRGICSFLARKPIKCPQKMVEK